MFKLVNSETKPLTLELAERFKAMLPSPTERAFDAGRAKMLREKAAALRHLRHLLHVLGHAVDVGLADGGGRLALRLRSGEVGDVEPAADARLVPAGIEDGRVPGGIEAEAAVYDPLFQRVMLRRRQTGLIRWRHDMRARVTKNLQPELRTVQELVASGELIEGQAGFFGSVAVAVVAAPSAAGGRVPSGSH